MSINTRYAELIEEMTTVRPLPTLQERKNLIEEINEDYFRETGKSLPFPLLNKLGDWYLADELGNKDKYKMEKEEYPILTEPQAKRRRKQVTHLDGELLDFFYVSKNDKVKAGKTARKEFNSDIMRRT